MSLFNQYIERYRREEEEFTLEEFLDICKQDRMAYASSAERMLAAIGEPELVDTRKDSRLSRLFSNRSEEHTSELQSLMRISYAVLCLKKKTNKKSIRQTLYIPDSK